MEIQDAEFLQLNEIMGPLEVEGIHEDGHDLGDDNDITLDF